jgi:hypothetical protein
MIAGGLFLPGSEAVGELCAVIRQDRANVNRAGGLQAFEEIQVTFFALVIVDVQENPTAGAVNGDEEIASGRFVRHFGQVLDVDMDEPRRIFLETLLLGSSILLFRRLGASKLPSSSRCRSRFRPERDTSELMKRRVTASRSSRGNSSRQRSSTTINSCAAESVVRKMCARCERSSGFSYFPRAAAIWMSWPC